MNVAAGHNKPDMRKSLTLHIQDEHHVDLKMQHIWSGIRPRSLKNSAALNARLINIVKNYNTVTDKIEYLKAISHCILNTVFFTGTATDNSADAKTADLNE